MVPFQLSSHSDLVMINAQTYTLQKTMCDQWQTKADAKVAYHDLKLEEGAANSFTLEPKHKIAFKPSQKADQLTIHNLAAKGRPGIWETEHTQIVWVMRWGPKGLTPVRPQIRLKNDVYLAPGQALAI